MRGGHDAAGDLRPPGRGIIPAYAGSTRTVTLFAKSQSTPIALAIASFTPSGTQQSHSMPATCAASIMCRNRGSHSSLRPSSDFAHNLLAAGESSIYSSSITKATRFRIHMTISCNSATACGHNYESGKEAVPRMGLQSNRSTADDSAWLTMPPQQSLPALQNDARMQAAPSSLYS